MRLCDLDNSYESIVYIRNTVDDVANPDEEIGFLSGNEDKLAVYLEPFNDTLDFLARSKLSSKYKGEELETKVSESVVKLSSKYNMQSMVALGTRGRTFHNSIIILDEAQNMSAATMQKLLTRVGQNSKVIVIGSLRQIDSKFLTKYTSGLTYLLDATKSEHNINLYAITLNKVLRSDIAEFAEGIFSKGVT